MDHISEIQKKHYSQKFEQFGATPKGVDWGAEKDVLLRYEKMLAVIDDSFHKEDSQQVSFLDVGCGYGGLFDFIKESKPSLAEKINYTGIDISENMIGFAKSKHSSTNFISGDFLSISMDEKFDYVVCNGILTQKLEVSILENDRYAQKLIRKMFDTCKVGIGFNAMKTKVNFMVENLYYRNPIEFLGWLTNEISSHFMVDHSYPLYEYTIYLYKK